MLGFYEKFPKTLHGAFTFLSSTSLRKLERALIEAFVKLNRESMVLEDVAFPTMPHCEAIFEFGIAEGNNFNYLNREEEQRILTAIRKAPLEVMDFICDIRYHKEENGKKAALRFDYYMLRFRFSQSLSEMLVFHEKGPRYVTPEDLGGLIIRRVNEKSGKRILNIL